MEELKASTQQQKYAREWLLKVSWLLDYCQFLKQNPNSQL